jgi:serine/threonine-protein kinase HipA
MRTANVYENKILAGELIEENSSSYIFRYDDNYFNDKSLSAISLTLPKAKREYHSEFLFPFFFNLLSEGVNKQVQLHNFKIDENDYFGLLLSTAKYDTIGAITIIESINNEPDNK